MSSSDYISSDLTPELTQVRDQIRKYAEDFGLDFFETIFDRPVNCRKVKLKTLRPLGLHSS